ncbi:MAG: hypothetical protein LBU42_08545 [Prevotellaceae bacterium]|nr:hypothetical protein [Prevotellaceae bacterium]
MKRILSILFVAVATINLSLFTVTPHHHHGAVMCAAAEHCGQDHTPDSDHTDSAPRHCVSCTAGTDAPAQPPHGHKCKCTGGDHSPQPLQPLAALLSAPGYVPAAAALSIPAVACNHASIHIPSPGIHRHAGLRAPPCVS